jgi:repressor LexA
MSKDVTSRQKELLTILYNYIRDTGYPPTFEEMRERLNVSSNQSVLDLLYQLEEKKLVKREEGTSRGITILPLGYQLLERSPLVPFLGTTSAGFPLEPIEISGEWQTISSQVTQLKDEIFLLKISGDSMINAGIDDGDIVLIKSQKEFVSGDIVLAQIGDEATIKRFISDDTPPFIYLKPENPRYEVIPFTEEVRLKGKVISVLKNNQWYPVVKRRAENADQKTKPS